MSKKVLISVISCFDPPYGEMVKTSLNTWDSINIEGCETIFYCGAIKEKDQPLYYELKSDKIVGFNIPESLFSMGFKDLAYFEWVLKNREWDYMARVNSSCFVDKKELIKYVQTLPDKEVFEGLEVVPHGWVWGGGMFLISRDVIQLILDNKKLWNHNEMEDMAMSKLVASKGIKFRPGRACSIDNMASGIHTLMVYGHGEGCTFSNWSEFKKPDGQFFYRIKQDHNRHLEPDIMEQLKRICYDRYINS